MSSPRTIAVVVQTFAIRICVIRDRGRRDEIGQRCLGGETMRVDHKARNSLKKLERRRFAQFGNFNGSKMSPVTGKFLADTEIHHERSHDRTKPPPKPRISRSCVRRAMRLRYLPGVPSSISTNPFTHATLNVENGAGMAIFPHDSCLNRYSRGIQIGN